MCFLGFFFFFPEAKLQCANRQGTERGECKLCGQECRIWPFLKPPVPPLSKTQPAPRSSRRGCPWGVCSLPPPPRGLPASCGHWGLNQKGEFVHILPCLQGWAWDLSDSFLGEFSGGCEWSREGAGGCEQSPLYPLADPWCITPGPALGTGHPKDVPTDGSPQVQDTPAPGHPGLRTPVMGHPRDGSPQALLTLGHHRTSLPQVTLWDRSPIGPGDPPQLVAKLGHGTLGATPASAHGGQPWGSPLGFWGAQLR